MHLYVYSTVLFLQPRLSRRRTESGQFPSGFCVTKLSDRAPNEVGVNEVGTCSEKAMPHSPSNIVKKVTAHLHSSLRQKILGVLGTRRRWEFD